MPLTQVQITTIKQTLIYDNLVHLIIAADNWAHARIKLRRFYVNVCVCGKHFHFPFKFNANLLAQQATFPYRPSGSLEHHLSRNWGLLSIFYFIFFFWFFWPFRLEGPVPGIINTHRVHYFYRTSAWYFRLSRAYITPTNTRRTLSSQPCFKRANLYINSVQLCVYVIWRVTTSKRVIRK